MSRNLVALGPKHYAAIRRKLDGASGTEIAEAVGVQRRTVYLWMGDPLVKDELARQLENVNEEAARRLAAASLVAIRQLVDVLERPVVGNPTVMETLAVAREVLDRYESMRASRDARSLNRLLEELSRSV